MSRLSTLVAVTLATLPAALACAQGGAANLTLTSGEEMNVTVLERGADSIRVEHALLGELTIPADAVNTLNGAPYAPPAVEQIAAQPEEDADSVSAAAVWTSSLELGLNGSEGNTENLSGRIAFRAERLEEDVKRFDFLTRYKLDTRDGDRTTNEWYTRALHEWFLPDHPRWSWFLQGDVEYNEFRDWDVRVSAFAGLGYIFIEEEDTTLRGRVGVGGAYEFGVMDEEIDPEALLGYDFEHQLNDRSRITSTGDLYPSLSNGGEFRSYWDAAYELDMTDAGDWVLRVGVDHQYDSDSDARPWDFSYFASVVMSF